MMLKLSLPGVDSAAIPTLTAEQVAQIPAEFLTFLHKCGQVSDLGDLKIITVHDDRHNFTIMSIAGWVANGRLETGELKVQLEQKPNRAQVTYDRSIHEQDVRFVATAETHARFEQRLGLYIFSVNARMNDLQAYLCRTICTEYPIYEAELIALLTTIFEHTDDLRRFNPTLASFVSERMLCLREILVVNSALLPLLRKAIPAKDRFLALAGRADISALKTALSELRRAVGEVDETDALLDTFIGQNSVSEDARQPVQPAPLVTPKTLGKRKGSKSSKPEAQSAPAKLSAKLAVGERASNGDSIIPQLANSNASTPSSTATNPTRPRRPHPDAQIYESGPTPTPGALKKIRRERPRIENEYWSITPENWNKLGDDTKRLYTHAGLICETEAGIIAPEPCNGCLELGEVCEVYNTADARNLTFGGACARCRLTSQARCSYSELKRTKKTHSL